MDYWDFSTLKEITASAALILAAEYDRIRQKGGTVPRAVDLHLWDPSVRKMLQGIGFFELCGIESPTIPVISGSGWRIVRFRSETLASGEQVSALLNELGLQDFDPQLYEAIFEAIVNTRHHAYPETHKFEEPYVPKWWLTGFLDEREGRLSISVLDQGLSIPVTLPGWAKYSLFAKFYKRAFRSLPDPDDSSRDGEVLRLAMGVGRTSTGQQNRGRGLPVMEYALDHCKDGMPAIFSRNGHYLRRKGKKSTTRNQATPLHGTLIQWDLRL